jgi:hypothetical protein
MCGCLLKFPACLFAKISQNKNDWTGSLTRLAFEWTMNLFVDLKLKPAGATMSRHGFELLNVT